MKKIISVLFCLCMVLCMCMSVSADTIPADRLLPRYTDDADLLTAEGDALILAKLDEISERRQFDVAIHTTNSTGGKSITAYADDFYDYNGFGYGADDDGCLLVVDIEGKDWWISTYGKGIEYITDDDIDYIGDEITGYLSNGDYYSAFDRYADICDDLAKGPSYNWFLGITISVGVGFVIALIVTGVLKGQLKSVRFQPAAKDYLVPGSLNVTTSRDIFLYRNVSRRAKPKESSGSSTHTSSSGRSHGGGGGSF